MHDIIRAVLEIDSRIGIATLPSALAGLKTQHAVVFVASYRQESLA